MDFSQPDSSRRRNSIAGCSVSLEGDGGGRYNAKAGADGKISFEKIEADTYTIIIDEEGHNLYKGKWIVENSSANDEVVNVTTPVLSVCETELHEDLNVEDKVEKTVTLEIRATVRLCGVCWLTMR